MKYLILVRHGDSDELGERSESGASQIIRLTESLRPIILSNSRVKVLTSGVPSAKESAKLIMGCLNICTELKKPLILSDDLHRLDPKLDALLGKLAKLVDEESVGIDVLILVTHFPQTQLFPPYYGREVLGVEGFCSDSAVVGGAVVIDCESRTAKVIP